jgi:hypothetical protein
MTDEEEKLIATRTDSRGMVRSMRVVDGKPAAPPIVMPEQPVAPLVPPKTSTVHVEGTFSDRARGFNIVTWNLSLVIGGVFVVVAAVLRNNEIGLMAMALVFFFGFSITWAIAYASHTFISPEGSQLYEIFRMWNYLDSEQRARHPAFIPARPHHRPPGQDRLQQRAAAGRVRLGVRVRRSREGQDGHGV